MCVESVMFSLIRNEICENAPDEFVKDELSSEMLKELFELSDKHDIAHIVASALSKIGLLNNNEKISLLFKKALKKAIYRDVQREYLLVQINNILENAKISHMMLKGATLCQYYPESWMRTSCDIDVLVKKENAESAIEYLCKAGFVRIKDDSTHDYNLIAENGMHIELHYTLSQDGELVAAESVLNKIWDEAIRTENHKYLYQMPIEQFFLYHLVHMGRHLLHGGCGIRPFIDLWILERKAIYDKYELETIFSNVGLLSFYKNASALGKVWMENKEHTETTKLLEKYVLFGGTYGNSKNLAQIQAAKGTSKIKAFIRLMFLPRENLEVIYPNLKKHQYLFYLYQIKRWFRIFNKKRRNKVKHLTKARNSVTQIDVDVTKNMLEHIGLLDK